MNGSALAGSSQSLTDTYVSVSALVPSLAMYQVDIVRDGDIAIALSRQERDQVRKAEPTAAVQRLLQIATSDPSRQALRNALYRFISSRASLTHLLKIPEPVPRVQGRQRKSTARTAPSGLGPGRPGIKTSQSDGLKRAHLLGLSSSRRIQRSGSTNSTNPNELRRGRSDPYPDPPAETPFRRRVTSHEPVETPPSIDEDHVVYVDSTPPIAEGVEPRTAEYRLHLSRPDTDPQRIINSHRQIINQEVDGVRVVLVQTSMNYKPAVEGNVASCDMRFLLVSQPLRHRRRVRHALLKISFKPWPNGDRPLIQRLHPDSRVIHATSQPIEIGHSVTNTLGAAAGEQHVNAHVDHSRGTNYRYPSTSSLSLSGLYTGELTLRLAENEIGQGIVHSADFDVTVELPFHPSQFEADVDLLKTSNLAHLLGIRAKMKVPVLWDGRTEIAPVVDA